MWKWFIHCKTAEEGKARYRELVRKYHPDNGYTGNEITEINVEFSAWFEVFKNIHVSKEGKTYTSKTSTRETARDFIDIMSKLSNLPGIEVELCGSWLWISGNTYPVKSQLHTFGCRWSKSKNKWYWTKDDLSNKARYKKPSMEYIRMRYGSQEIEITPTPCLQ